METSGCPAVTCWPSVAATERITPLQFWALTTVVVWGATLPEAVATEEMAALLTVTVRAAAAVDEEPAAVAVR
ncbi:hypothetical protein NG819_03900 [Pseudarthrobacter sp. Fe7]|nr:hypothetical protein NG819_03900 [Pseudarthrobacter sp. Fe7]